jgi:hypothetical protein
MSWRRIARVRAAWYRDATRSGVRWPLNGALHQLGRSGIVPPRVLFFSFFVDRTPGSSDAKHCAGLALLCVLDSTEVRGRRADAEVPGEFCERGAWVSRSSRALTIVASAPATAHSSFDVGSAEGHIRTCPGACRLRFLFDLSRTDRCVSCAHVVCRTPSFVYGLYGGMRGAPAVVCRVVDVVVSTGPRVETGTPSALCFLWFVIICFRSPENESRSRVAIRLLAS